MPRRISYCIITYSEQNYDHQFNTLTIGSSQARNSKSQQLQAIYVKYSQLFSINCIKEIKNTIESLPRYSILTLSLFSFSPPITLQYIFPHHFSLPYFSEPYLSFDIQNTIQQISKMGNICAAPEVDRGAIECTHKKRTKKGKGQSSIRTEIRQDYVCQLCREMKQMRAANQDARMERISEVSLTSHDSEMLIQSAKKLKINKTPKKTISDFQFVRGLGKGAFGRVYMIREREAWEPLHEKLDILSINEGDFQDEEAEMAEELVFQDKKQSQESITYRSQKENKDTSNSLVEEAPKLKKNLSKTSQKNPQSASKIMPSAKFYALKILKKSQITSEHGIKQARSQRDILESMDHPFVVKLHYAFQTKSRLFLIVDLLAGGELFYLLRKMKKFSEEMTRFYAAEILLALEYLHSKSIIYRDLKPQNILLDAEGQIKITDFGLSKMMYSENQKTYSLCGTPEYIAPEVIIGGGYTQAADWFSYGSLIYDMLTGRPPFLNSNKQAMLKNLVTTPVPLPYYLSDDAKELLTGLFKIKPEERLGYNGPQAIKSNIFFKGINWSDLLNKKIKAPVTFTDQLKFQKEQCYVNNNGFENWNSWQMNMESPTVKKTKQSKEHFEGFTYENYEYEYKLQDDTPTPELKIE